MIFECPGSKNIKRPTPENIKCPSCGEEVEIWSDEAKTKCPKCKTIVFRKEEQSCLNWCEYAKECIGEKKYNKYIKKGEDNYERESRKRFK